MEPKQLKYKCHCRFCRLHLSKKHKQISSMKFFGGDIKLAVEWYKLHFNDYTNKLSDLWQEYIKIPLPNRDSWENWIINKAFEDVISNELHN